MVLGKPGWLVILVLFTSPIQGAELRCLLLEDTSHFGDVSPPPPLVINASSPSSATEICVLQPDTAPPTINARMGSWEANVLVWSGEK